MKNILMDFEWDATSVRCLPLRQNPTPKKEKKKKNELQLKYFPGFPIILKARTNYNTPQDMRLNHL